MTGNWMQNHMIYRFFLLSVLLTVSIGGITKSPAKSGDDYYLFAVFPYMAASQLNESYGVVAAAFASILERPVKLISAPDYELFSLNLKKGRYDIAMIQPFDYVVAVDSGQYVPVARVDASLRANFATLNKSPIKSLQDLKNRTLSLPQAQAAVSRLALKTLRDAGLRPGVDVNVRHYQSFGSCLQSVLASYAQACATGKAVLKIFEKRMKVKFRLFAESATIPHMLFVALTRLPSAEINALKESIIQWRDHDSGRRILGNIRFPGFTAIDDTDYDAVRGFEQTDGVE